LNTEDDSLIIFNHLEITVETHKTTEGHERIVAFDVEPFSLADDENRFIFSEKYKQPSKLLKANDKVTFTYSIFTKTNTHLTWTTRLDHYMKLGNNEIHLMQLIISFSIVSAFGVIVAMILKRSLNRDFTNIELSNVRRREIRQQRA